MTNFADQTVGTGDRLDILRCLNFASVDLIYRKNWRHPPYCKMHTDALP